MRIVSWNVNGLRACAKKGFCGWLTASEADLVCVQEVRSREDQLPPEVCGPDGWHTHFVAADKAGYSGVGLFSRRAPDAVTTTLGEDRFDTEGRVQIARFGQLVVANVYFPNGNGTPLPGGKRSNDRIPYKLAFYEALFDQLEPERAAGAPILVLGDFNTAPAAIDLARPKQNLGTSGFTPEETEHLAGILGRGWTDTFRHFHPGAEGHYTWWSQRFGIREKNIGWRIDLVVASPGALPFVKGAFIHPHVKGSDHCPLGVDVDPAICGPA